ncbi:tetratricopeptide repeat protein [Streptomyces flavotricini]|uniref:Tetratricopeptide repeat protein n=1 Tax=Streptomyces flavotricini TaxID=66888 RepID=A0ABS8E5Y9_9ACTN|nr:tetratricopeptide repeat protein [Streptomyces flavotricini]MCC0096114.1 tetratricopeptide repeat protein [Streptomyces flavotricini]
MRQLETVAREGQAVTAYVDESVADVVETMEVISAQFAQQGVALKGFDKLLATYRQRRHEADAGMATAAAAGADAAAGGSPAPSPSSVIASQLGLVGLGMLPGVGAFTGAVDPNQVAAGADRVKALLSTRLRSHGDVELVLSLLDALTPVFLEELGEVARKHPWIVLFFDTYERTGPMLDTWLRDVLGSDRYGELPANVLVTLAGQSRLAARCWEDWHDLVTDWPLEVFTDAEARRLLAGKGVTDERVVEVVLQLSGRLPVLVSTLAETQPRSVEEIGDPSGTAVERFLKWEPDPARRAAALACAFPQELDEDVFRAAVEEEAAELFGWLRSMPFVTDRSGHCRYHEVVRSAMLRLQRRQSPARWELLHTRLADAFRLRREHLEAAVTPADGWWSDETWRGHRLQETYHRLCADPRAALPAAMRELVDAYDHGVTTLRRWVQVLIQAGRDTQGSELTNWGERLRTALEHRDAGVATLTLLLSRGALDTAGQALALTLRGRDHRNAERYPHALADYTHALTLDPEAGRAHFGRGWTHMLTDDLDAATADFCRAVELDPGNGLNLSHRGIAHYRAGRYVEALEDLDRALELDAASEWALAGRGLALQEMGRHEEALTEFTRAANAAPDSAWPLLIRGIACVAMERHEEGVADFTRGLELDPDHGPTLARRGGTYRTIGRYEEAVADLTRAAELGDVAEWVFSDRGFALVALGRLEEAVRDFTRALALSPDYASALGGRGGTYGRLGRYEEALADLDRAVELRPEYGWALDRRGELNELLGRYEEALADYDRSVLLYPDDAWTLRSRGQVHWMLGRYEESLADYDRSVLLDPDDAWTLRGRGKTHQKLGRYEESLADFGRAVHLLPGNCAPLTARGVTYRVLGRYDEALADLVEAADLDCGNAWTHYETAVVLHALGHPDRDRHLARVLELTPNGAPAEGGSAADLGNLVLAHCVWPRWERAGQHLAEFLAKVPPPGQMHELLVALRSLIPVIPSAESRIEELCRAVEGRLDGPS